MPPSETPKVKVVLLTDNHTHAGHPCAKNDVIEVSEAQAARLAEAKIARPATKAEAAKQEG